MHHLAAGFLPAFVASPVWQLVNRFGWSSVASMCTPAMTFQLVVPAGERRGFIHRYHDSIFAGHFGVFRTVCSVLAGTSRGCSSLSGQLFGVFGPEAAMSSPCTDGHVAVGHRWDRVAMDILDMSVTMDKGNQYALVIVDCFSRWTEACPLPNKTAVLWLTHFSS